MNGQIVGRFIEDMDNKSVSLSGVDSRARQASVHCGNHSWIAQSPDGKVLHLHENKSKKNDVVNKSSSYQINRSYTFIRDAK